MKEQLVVLAAVAAVVAGAAAVSAQTIVGTAHDLSGKGFLTGNNEICIFCHTPHNAELAVPLWNRVNPCVNYTLYNASVTLTAATNASSITDPTSISKFCMNCHDGVTFLGSIKNSNGGVNTFTTIGNTLGGNLTTNLTTTHPVGFDYNAAATADTGLRSIIDATATLLAGNPSGAVFFGSGGNSMECASCHSVHDDKNTHFLRQSNANSNLCLACHNK